MERRVYQILSIDKEKIYPENVLIAIYVIGRMNVIKFGKKTIT